MWGAHSTADMYAHVGTSLAKMTPRRIPGTATGTGEGVLLDSRGRRRNLGLGGEVSEREGQVLFAGDAIKRERDGCQSSRAHTHATHMQLRRGFGRRCDSLYVLLLLWMHGKKKVHDRSWINQWARMHDDKCISAAYHESVCTSRYYTNGENAKNGKYGETLPLSAAPSFSV